MQTRISPLDFTAPPSGECWGRITQMSKRHTDGRLIIREVEVRKNILEELLAKHGFSNKSTCIDAWKTMGVLDYEDPTHPCRSRKVDPNSEKEKVYVLRFFDEDEVVNPTCTQTWLAPFKPSTACKEGGDLSA